MEIINTSQPNDFMGDRLRDAFIKINNNFGELISELDNPILIQDINGLANTLNSLQQQINEIQTFEGEPLMYQAGYGITIIGNVISAVDNSFSGDYNDLVNKPVIPEATSDLVNDSGFITIEDVPSGFDGDYNSLTNKPTIPSDTNDLTNGAGYITINDVPSGFDGDYNSLTNKPTIPSDTNDLTNGAGYITINDIPSGGDVEWDDVLNKPSFFSGLYDDLTGKPTLFSGNYNDLINKPVINPVSSNSISFRELNIYGSYSSPRTGAITFDLTDAKFGYIQEVYHTGSSMPVLPGSAKIVNDVEYSNSKVNLLLFKYISASRVEVVVNVLEN